MGNVALYTDGGRRNGKAASAWLLVISTQQDPFVPYKAGGQYWPEGVTAFGAEVHAMEWGIQALTEHTRRLQ